MTRRMLRLVSGDACLTETGGLVRFQQRDGTLPWPYDERRAARYDVRCRRASRRR
jgi:hypothetical protein